MPWSAIMPNWTDDERFNWFKILECKRCLGRFDEDDRGEIPEHECLGGIYRSESSYYEYHYPVFIRPLRK